MGRFAFVRFQVVKTVTRCGSSQRATRRQFTLQSANMRRL